MGLVERVLPNAALDTLAAAEDRGAGVGLRAARGIPADTAIEVLRDSGLRGRGGAGFPTWRKWRTVADHQVTGNPTTVVVNAAEGEPGCFKDRLILRRDPYAVLEGALIAAHTLGADCVIVALKESFTNEIARLDDAITEIEKAGWPEGIDLRIFEGPGEYLFGEETGLLEAIDGRPPFPRVAPPYRHGVDEELDEHASAQGDLRSPAHVEMAAPAGASDAPPTLAQNAETLANVPGIFAHGAPWFREVGTDDSPGTIVCTVSGHVRHAGVGEVALGTPLGEIIDLVGGGAQEGHELLAAMSGVSNALVPAKLFDTPATYEDLLAIGSGLGAAGFLVYDDTCDLTAVAAGVSRFLAVESCGQCTRCKQDGLELADLLAKLTRSRADDAMRDRIDQLLSTVAEGARCNLASQQQVVVDSVLGLVPDLVDAHVQRELPADPEPIAPIVGLEDGRAVLDERQATKQPDWTHGPDDSGQWPADRLDEHRAPDGR
jgi:NADH:ubiquinone oxidoreductase subunit F (NADH-binding)